MGVSRDCGHFMVGLSISGGLHDAPGQIGKMDKQFRDRASKALLKLKEKHEQAVLAEWCEAIGWDEEKSKAAAEAAEQDRKDLLEADRKGRAMRHKQREEAGIG